MQFIDSSVAVRVAAILAGAGAAVAQAEDVPVSFDHKSKVTTTDKVTVAAGDRIVVTINNTCPDRFDYQSVPFESELKPDRDKLAIQALQAGCVKTEAEAKLLQEGFCELKSRPVSFVHEERFGAYKILVSPKADTAGTIKGLSKADLDQARGDMVTAPGDACVVPGSAEQKAAKLEKAEFILRVDSSPWALGMSGGLTVSSVVDPRFAVVNDANSTTTPPGTLVIRDRGAEDSEKLGFGGFLHVHHKDWHIADIPVAGSFGLGIQEKNSISGFVGVSAAAFDLAYLTLGWNWSSVDRLPAGQRVGAAPMNDNVLNNLPTRVDSGWFLAVTFKLMSPGESFFKEKTTKPKVEDPAKP